MRNSHIVLKRSDVAAINPAIASCLEDVCLEVQDLRFSEGKNPVPNHIVINMDEPYINEVIEVLRRHNAWED